MHQIFKIKNVASNCQHQTCCTAKHIVYNLSDIKSGAMCFYCKAVSLCRSPVLSDAVPLDSMSEDDNFWVVLNCMGNYQFKIFDLTKFIVQTMRSSSSSSCFCSSRMKWLHYRERAYSFRMRTDTCRKRLSKHSQASLQSPQQHSDTGRSVTTTAL